MSIDINWNTSFKKKKKKIREIKLKWYQIRLVQCILVKNVVLAHMGVEKDVTCSFCGKERDAIEHIFLEMRTCKTILGTIADSSK